MTHEQALGKTALGRRSISPKKSQERFVLGFVVHAGRSRELIVADCLVLAATGIKVVRASRLSIRGDDPWTAQALTETLSHSLANRIKGRFATLFFNEWRGHVSQPFISIIHGARWLHFPAWFLFRSG